MNTALDQLTIKQIKFCEEYIRHDGNATNAYISAYKAKNRYSAAKCGSQLLKKQPIKEYVKVLMHDAGLNDIVADKGLLKLIQQDKNPYIKLSAIDKFNKMAGRAIYNKETNLEASRNRPKIIIKETYLKETDPRHPKNIEASRALGLRPTMSN